MLTDCQVCMKAANESTQRKVLFRIRNIKLFALTSRSSDLWQRPLQEMNRYFQDDLEKC